MEIITNQTLYIYALFVEKDSFQKMAARFTKKKILQRVGFSEPDFY